MKRPNILWISFEDTNPIYGCCGDKVARTPNLDSLASEGCLFTNAFSTAGVCAPARSAVITGMYPVSIGTHHMRTTHTNPAAPDLPTPYAAVTPHYVKCFTEYLRAGGYYCTNNHKTDYQFDPPSSAWDECGREAHWRNRPGKDTPFFSVFNLEKTHESGMWPEKCPEIRFSTRDMQVPPYFPDTEEVRKALARMYTNIEHNDALLGELLGQLEEDGLADNTAVFHWSDHGPLPRGKRWPYDSGIRVPLIVRHPGEIRPGTVRKELVSTVDLAPTVLSILGMEIPWHMQGKAFLGPRAEGRREYVYAARDRCDESYDMVRAVRDKRFKYIRNYCPHLPYMLWVPYRNRHPIVREMYRLYSQNALEGPQLLMFRENRPVEELYDTENDPYEIDNLAGLPDFQKELARLRTALDEWLGETGDMGNTPEEEMARKWLPQNTRPSSARPVFIPICPDSPGIEPARGGGRYRAPLFVQIYCSTQGSSIEYALDSGKKRRWRLYAGPIRMNPGKTRIMARSCRIGYSEAENEALFEVNG